MRISHLMVDVMIVTRGFACNCIEKVLFCVSDCNTVTGSRCIRGPWFWSEGPGTNTIKPFWLQLILWLDDWRLLMS